MSDYVKATNFAAKDSLATGNPAKIIKGTEIDNEFNSIATAVSSKADTSYVDAQIAAAGTGSVSSVATGTGLTGGPITTTGTISLANTGVTAGTYGQAGVSYPIITVDAQGRITAASVSTNFGSGGGVTGVTSFNSRTGAVTLSSNDVVTALGYTPSNVTLSGSNNWTGSNTFSSITATAYNVGNANSSINYSSNSVKIAVDGTTISRYLASGNVNYMFLSNSGTGGVAYDAGNNSVGVGFQGGTFWLIYSSYIEASTGDVRKPGGGSFNSTSDVRLKENIVDYSKGLSAIKQLRTVSYNYTGKLGEQTKNKTFVGLIAQEVEQTQLSSTVATDKDGFKTVDSSEILYTLVNAVKELSAEVESLKAQLAAK